LSVLFLFAYQLNKLHTNKHFVEEVDCYLCEASAQLSINTHETNIHIELNTLKSTKAEKGSALKKPLTHKHISLVPRVDFLSLQKWVISPIPLGQYSHAPPTYFFINTISPPKTTIRKL